METKQESIKVLVFGTFDKIHDGHIFFLREAQKLGSILLVCVSSDENVARLKKNTPLLSQEERKKAVEALSIADEVHVGDNATNKWSLVKKLKPQIVAVGYDQRDLEIALSSISEDFDFEIVRLRSHLPDTMHSSLLNKI